MNNNSDNNIKNDNERFNEKGMMVSNISLEDVQRLVSETNKNDFKFS